MREPFALRSAPLGRRMDLVAPGGIVCRSDRNLYRRLCGRIHIRCIGAVSLTHIQLTIHFVAFRHDTFGFRCIFFLHCEIFWNVSQVFTRKSSRLNEMLGGSQIHLRYLTILKNTWGRLASPLGDPPLPILEKLWSFRLSIILTLLSLSTLGRRHHLRI